MDRSLDISADDFQEHTDSDREKDDFDDIFEGLQQGPEDTDYPSSNKKQRIDDLPNDLTDEDLEPNTVRPGDGQPLMDDDDEDDSIQNNAHEDEDDQYPLGAEGTFPPMGSLGAQIPRLPAMESDIKGPPHSFAAPVAGGFLGHPYFMPNINFGSATATHPPPQPGAEPGISSYTPPPLPTQASFNEMKNTLMSGCLSFEGGGEITTGRKDTEETGEEKGQGAAVDNESNEEATQGNAPIEEQLASDVLGLRHGDPTPPPSAPNDEQGSAEGPWNIPPAAHVPQHYNVSSPQIPPFFQGAGPWEDPMCFPQVPPNIHMTPQQPIHLLAPVPPQAAMSNFSPPPPPHVVESFAQQQKHAEVIAYATLDTKVEPSKGIPVSSSYDVQELTKYQALIRQQFEFFEATLDDVQGSVQGRRKKLSVGQVGIRCKHCAHRPLRHRGKSSVYYPSYLGGVYQAAQNMAKTHLCESCDSIPATLKERIRYLQKQGGLGKIGKIYWVEGCRFIGIIETDDKKLRFKWSRIENSSTEEQKEG